MNQFAKCTACKDGAHFDIPITMAFQPIVDIETNKVFAYEALLRGKDGAGAGTILSCVSDETRYAFDQTCRVTAIELAARLGLASDGALLSINFLPNAVYEPRACIRLTLETARSVGFPLDRILFEFTEGEQTDTAHLLKILRAYRELGFSTAIDDFGAGFSGLSLLSAFIPDIVKIDMDLVRDIDTSSAKRIIVGNTLRMMHELGIRVVCEGIETEAEFACLKELGATLMQGYLIARPQIEALPAFVLPDPGPIVAAALEV